MCSGSGEMRVSVWLRGRASLRAIPAYLQLRLEAGVLDRGDHRGRERRLRLVVARRVVLSLRDLEDLDHAVVDEHGEALAPADDALGLGPRMDQLHAERRGE